MERELKVVKWLFYGEYVLSDGHTYSADENDKGEMVLKRENSDVTLLIVSDKRDENDEPVSFIVLE